MAMMQTDLNLIPNHPYNIGAKWSPAMAGKLKLKLKRWDSAAHLKTEAEVARYWEACVDEGRDAPAFIVAALGNIARAKGMTGLARKTGLTREALYKALSPDGNPEFGTVMRVIRALGLEIHGSAAKR